MSIAAGWLADPSGEHELRYWDGAGWTGHVVDAGVQATAAVPAELPDPVPAAAPPPPPPVAATTEPAAPAAGRGSWKNKLKQVAQQGRTVAEQAKGAIAEQQSKRAQQWA